MKNQKQDPGDIIPELIETCGILRAALRGNDEEKANETVTIMLMQAVNFLGLDSPLMEHLFPPMDMIRRRLEDGNAAGALGQTEVFEAQLHEIRDLVRKRS
jgi:hypothetical protein